MADISMCNNKDCPSKESCYRFKATPNPHRQSYMKFEVPKGRKKCDSYWKIKNIKNEK